MSEFISTRFQSIESLTRDIDADQLTAKWLIGNGLTNLHWLDDVSKEDGFCYLRLFVFGCDFACLRVNEFSEMITGVKSRLGPCPKGGEIFTEMMTLFLLKFGEITWFVNPDAVSKISERFNCNRIRVKSKVVKQVIHITFHSPHPFCECESLICQHGFDYRMMSVSSINSGRRIGASDFDMAKFLGQGMNIEEEPFEDVYSRLEPSGNEMPQQQQAKAEADNINLGLQNRLRRTQQEREEMKNLLSRLQEENTNLVENKPMSPPSSPPLRKARIPETELTITPQDSSSMISRYQRRYMNEGTVLVPGRVGTEADNKDYRTVLTVDNSLIDGFQMTNELAQNERISLNRLRPINGLPRPFTNMRLNFLANIHTAINKAINKYPNSHTLAMFKAMRTRPDLPCDELLYQVLTSTIDKGSNMFASNAFKLPYVEVGMHVTEDSIVKTFELLYLEYKALWFQEVKNIIVPDFHNHYGKYSTDTIPSERIRSDRKDKHRVHTSQSKSKKKGSTILGF